MNTTVENRYIWLDGKIMHLPDAQINVLSPTSQFGANVFEGIRCYWNAEAEQLYAFRLDDHYKRLKQSQFLLQMDDCFSVTEMKQALIDVVIENDYKEDISVRQTLFINGFGSWASKGPVSMFVAPIPKGKVSNEYNKKGLKCCISSWDRIDDNSLSPRIKCGANYINSRMAQLEALNNGYDTAIFLSKKGMVSEGPGSCLFLVKDNALITPLTSDSILESITRDTVIKIARGYLGITVEERSVCRTELYTCDEAFLCGSAMEITAVLSVDQYQFNNGMIGEITSKIHETYLNLVTGKISDYSNWLTPIYEK